MHRNDNQEIKSKQEGKQDTSWKVVENLIDKMIDSNTRIMRYKTTVRFDIQITIFLWITSIVAFLFGFNLSTFGFVFLSIANMIVSMRGDAGCREKYKNASDEIISIVDHLYNREKINCVKHMIHYCHIADRTQLSLIENASSDLSGVKLKVHQKEYSLKRTLAIESKGNSKVNKSNASYELRSDLNKVKSDISEKELALNELKLTRMAITNTLRFLNIQMQNVVTIINASKVDSSNNQSLTRVLSQTLSPVTKLPDLLGQENNANKNSVTKQKSEHLSSNQSKRSSDTTLRIQELAAENKLVSSNKNISNNKSKRDQEQKGNRKNTSQRKRNEPVGVERKTETSHSSEKNRLEKERLIKDINTQITKYKAHIYSINECISEIESLRNNAFAIKTIAHKTKPYILKTNTIVNDHANRVAQEAAKEPLDAHRQVNLLNAIAKNMEDHVSSAKREYQEILSTKIDLLADNQQYQSKQNEAENFVKTQKQKEVASKLKILKIKENKDDWVFDLHNEVAGEGAILFMSGSASAEFGRQKYDVVCKEIPVKDIDLRISNINHQNESKIVDILTKFGFKQDKVTRFYIKFMRNGNNIEFDLTLERPGFVSNNPIHISRQTIVYNSHCEWLLIDKNNELKNALRNNILDSDMPNSDKRVTMLFSMFIKYHLKFNTFELSENYKIVLFSYVWQANYIYNKMSVKDEKRQYSERDACYAEIFSIMSYRKSFDCHNMLCAFFTVLLKEKIVKKPSRLAFNLATIVNDYFLENPLSRIESAKETVFNECIKKTTRYQFYDAIDDLVLKRESFQGELDDKAKKMGFDCIRGILENKFAPKETNHTLSPSMFSASPKSSELERQALSQQAANQLSGFNNYESVIHL